MKSLSFTHIAMTALLLNGAFVRCVYAADSAKLEGASGLTDAQIAKILKTANEGEIDAGKTALKHAQNADVKAFAQKMVDEHKANEKTESDVTKQASIKYDKSEQSKELETDAKAKISHLKDQKKETFDKAYMQSQVEMHQALLNDLDTNFIPAAQNPQLKKYLQDTREHVKMHLDEAKKLNDGMKM